MMKPNKYYLLLLSSLFLLCIALPSCTYVEEKKEDSIHSMFDYKDMQKKQQAAKKSKDKTDSKQNIGFFQKLKFFASGATNSTLSVVKPPADAIGGAYDYISTELLRPFNAVCDKLVDVIGVEQDQASQIKDRKSSSRTSGGGTSLTSY